MNSGRSNANIAAAAAAVVVVAVVVVVVVVAVLKTVHATAVDQRVDNTTDQ